MIANLYAATVAELCAEHEALGASMDAIFDAQRLADGTSRPCTADEVTRINELGRAQGSIDRELGSRARMEHRLEQRRRAMVAEALTSARGVAQ